MCVSAYEIACVRASFVRACVHTCARACLRVCLRACLGIRSFVHAFVRACVRTCARACERESVYRATYESTRALYNFAHTRAKSLLEMMFVVACACAKTCVKLYLSVTTSRHTGTIELARDDVVRGAGGVANLERTRLNAANRSRSNHSL